MDPVERDDFLHALGQTLEFYGKKLDKMQSSFWLTACRDKSADKLKRALIEHTKTGKYAPKPADVLGLVDMMREQGAARELPPPPTTNCPPEIAKAWMWFNTRLCLGSSLEGIFSSKLDISIEEQEKYLHVVNHEAHKYDMPDAIPDEYKLQEVWG